MARFRLKSVCSKLVSLRLLVLARALCFHCKPCDWLCLSLFMPNLLSSPCPTSLFPAIPSHLQPLKTSRPLPVWAVQHSLCKLLLKWHINHFCILCVCVCVCMLVVFYHKFHALWDMPFITKVTKFFVSNLYLPTWAYFLYCTLRFHIGCLG
jgi:hypothetical protein